MAVYTFSVIETNLVGDTGVIIKEDSATNGMALLLNSLGDTNYIIDQLCLWTDNKLQLDNLIFVDDVDPNGNVTSYPFVPFIDSNSLQNQCCFNFNDHKFDQNTRLRYDIKGFTNLRLSFKMSTNSKLSISEKIKEIAGDEFEAIKTDIGQIEPEEKTGWDKAEPSKGKEPEEKGGGGAKPANDNILKMQDNLDIPLEVVFDLMKKEDLLKVTIDESFVKKQIDIGTVSPGAPLPTMKTIIKKPKTYKYDNQMVTIIVLGAVGVWLLSGRPDLKQVLK